MSAIEVNISSSLSSTSECHILLLCLEVVVNSQNVTFNVIVSAIEVNISSSLSPTSECHILLLCLEVVVNSQNVTFNVIVSAIEVNISSSLSQHQNVTFCYCVLRLSSTVRMSHSMLLCWPLRLTFLLLCRQQSECHIQCYCVGH